MLYSRLAPGRMRLGNLTDSAQVEDLVTDVPGPAGCGTHPLLPFVQMEPLEMARCVLE